MYYNTTAEIEKLIIKLKRQKIVMLPFPPPPFWPSKLILSSRSAALHAPNALNRVHYVRPARYEESSSFILRLFQWPNQSPIFSWVVGELSSLDFWNKSLLYFHTSIFQFHRNAQGWKGPVEVTAQTPWAEYWHFSHRTQVQTILKLRLINRFIVSNHWYDRPSASPDRLCPLIPVHHCFLGTQPVTKWRIRQLFHMNQLLSHVNWMRYKTWFTATTHLFLYFVEWKRTRQCLGFHLLKCKGTVRSTSDRLQGESRPTCLSMVKGALHKWEPKPNIPTATTIPDISTRDSSIYWHSPYFSKVKNFIKYTRGITYCFPCYLHDGTATETQYSWTCYSSILGMFYLSPLCL